MTNALADRDFTLLDLRVYAKQRHALALESCRNPLAVLKYRAYWLEKAAQARRVFFTARQVAALHSDASAWAIAGCHNLGQRMHDEAQRILDAAIRSAEYR